MIGRAIAKHDGMSPAHIVRQSRLLAGIATLAFATCAAASTQTADRPSRTVKRAASQAHPAKALHDGGGSTVSVAEIFERGNFAMQVGQTAVAIAAFEKVLKLDPNCTDAWGKLAFLYVKEGNPVKSVEAFKKAKRYGDANCGAVTRGGSGGLQFP